MRDYFRSVERIRISGNSSRVILLQIVPLELRVELARKYRHFGLSRRSAGIIDKGWKNVSLTLAD